MISLEEFLKYMVKKWKLVITIVVVSCLIFTAAMKIFYKTVVTEDSVLQEYYSVQVELYEDIVENPESENLDKAFFDEAWKNKVLFDHFKEELRLSPIGYMENVTLKSAAVFGTVVGCILSVSITFALFAKKSKSEE